jgi:hypothetical protein
LRLTTDTDSMSTDNTTLANTDDPDSI